MLLCGVLDFVIVSSGDGQLVGPGISWAIIVKAKYNI